jgi:uncharacterized phage-associated protein
MRVPHEREKLINAMVFFAKNTNNCGKIKLFKLLYLLDFNHFAETGLSVTGLEYRAWEKGPVPRALYAEWEAMRPDMGTAIEIKQTLVGDYYRQTVLPQVDFDPSHFTKRELRILTRLAEEYRDYTAQPMVDTTHVANGAWAQVWKKPGNDNVIPYELAVSADEPNRAEILMTAEEHANYCM